MGKRRWRERLDCWIWRALQRLPEPQRIGPAYYIVTWLLGLALILPIMYLIGRGGVTQVIGGSRWDGVVGAGIGWTLCSFWLLPKELKPWNDDEDDPEKGSS